MERLTSLQHRGVPILFVDYGGTLSDEEARDLIWASSARIIGAPVGSVRVLTSLAEIRFSAAILGDLKEAAARNKPHLRGVAVIGLSGLFRALFSGLSSMFGGEVALFDTREDALEWLAALP